MEVQGFGCGGSQNAKAASTKAEAVNTNAAEMNIEASRLSAPLETGRSEVAQARDKGVHDSNTAGPQVQIHDFEAALKGIDDAIITDSAMMISKAYDPDSTLAMIDNDQLVEINGDFSEILGSQTRILEKVEPQLTSRNPILPPRKLIFEMGRVDKQQLVKQVSVGLKNVVRGENIKENILMGQ